LVEWPFLDGDATLTLRMIYDSDDWDCNHNAIYTIK